MFVTQYPNNSRVVSGDVVIYQDDVILLCDTFTAPVTINLQNISYDYWNTTYKVYIVDNSKKAGTNNITIVAGDGQTINGLPTLTINTNGGIAVIRISSNTSYIATLSSQSSGGGGGYTTIQDEGVALPPQSIINFIGANVTAEDDPTNNRTNVTIGGLGIVELTNAEMLALMTAGTVIPGQLYLVTDGGNSDLGVLIQGVTTKSTTVGGAGLFLNADYQGAGVYTSVPTYNVFKGIWSTFVLSVSIGDVVVYNNLNYLNMTGNWGSAPSSDTTNWALLPKNTTKGYILELDVVRYDVQANIIRYRADKRYNEVEYNAGGRDISTNLFQWGRNACTGNKVLSGSYMDCTNSSATFTNNFVSGASIIDNTSAEAPGTFNGNILFPSSQIFSVETQGNIYRNRLIGNETQIRITTLLQAASAVSENDLSEDSTIVCLSLINVSYIRKNTLKSSNITVDYLDNGIIQQCTLFNQSNISTPTGSHKKIEAGDITNMSLTTGNFYFDYISTASVSGCNIEYGTVSITSSITALSFLENRSYRIGYSNWPYALNLGSNIVGTELQLPYQWIGELTLTNCAAYTITAIGGAGVQTNHPVKIIGTTASGAETFTILPIAIASASANDIVSNSALSGSGTYTPRTNCSDYAVIKAGYPAQWVLIEKNILA